MVAWVELFEIGNPNVHISMFPGLIFLRLAIRICSSIFVDWRSECAYPMVSWVYLLKIGNPSVYTRWLPRFSFSRLAI